MPKLFNHRPIQWLAIITLVVLGVNLMVGNVLEQPKTSQAIGMPTIDIASILGDIGHFIWEVIKQSAQEAFRRETQKQLTTENLKQWAKEKLTDATQKALKKAQKNIMDQLVDNLTDTIEGRKTSDGQAQYVKDWEGVFKDALAMGAYEFSQELAGVDLCSPLGFESKAEAKLALEIPITKFAEEMPCTRQEMIDNVKGFYASFEGGWDAWLKVTRPNQNFSSSYLMALDAKVDAMARAQQAATVKVQAGGGWLGKEECMQWFSKDYNITLEKNYKGDIKNTRDNRSALQTIFQQIIDYPLQDALANCGLADQDMEEADLLVFFTDQRCANNQNKRACTCLNKCLDKFPNDCLETMQSIPQCQNVNQDCIINDYKTFQCTKKETKTPGDLVGQSVAKILNYESDWFLSSGDFGQYSAAIVNAGIARASRWGLDKLNKLKKSISFKFGSDEEKEASQTEPEAFCQDEPDIISRRACQMCPGLTKGSKAYQACMEYQRARQAEDLLISGAIGETTDWANLEGLALVEQAINTKEQISRALQNMGGASYYSRVQDVKTASNSLIKCRWQTCGIYEILRFLVKHCGFEGQEYEKLFTRDKNGENGCGKPVCVSFKDSFVCTIPNDKLLNDDLWGLRSGEMLTSQEQNTGGNRLKYMAEDEKKCGQILKENYSGNTLEKACRNHCRKEKDCGKDKCWPSYDNWSACYTDCLQYPHASRIKGTQLCLDLAEKEAVGPYDDEFYNTDLDQYYPYINSEWFTDQAFQATCLVSPISCDIDDQLKGWPQPISCFQDGAWIEANEEYSRIAQKAPRYDKNNTLVPGWWDYEGRVQIDDQILALEKEIGQDSSYPQIHPGENNIGVIDMTYEYGQQCRKECNPDDCSAICDGKWREDCPLKESNEYPNCTDAAQYKDNCVKDCKKTKDTSCYQECTHIDVFDELTMADIGTMFKPWGVAEAESACRSEGKDKEGTADLNQCINDKLKISCADHCQKNVCQGNGQCENDCQNVCQKQRVLGISCTKDTDSTRLLHCRSEERSDKLGSLRILQWDILDINRDLESSKIVRDFVEQTLDVCPAVKPPDDPKDPAYKSELAKYEQNILTKAETEQALSSEVKDFSRRLYKQVNSNQEPPPCRLWLHNEEGNRYREDKFQNTLCPLTMLWYNWSTNIEKCHSYNPQNQQITEACPLGCQRTYDAWKGQYRTFLQYVEESVKGLEDTLNNKKAQIPSQTDLQEAQELLTKINDFMDPEKLKQKVQDITNKLDNEKCKTILGKDKWRWED